MHGTVEHVPCSVVQPCLPCAIQEELDKLKFFAKPKLALDAVGGASAVRLSDALSEVGGIVHGACSWCICIGRPVHLPETSRTSSMSPTKRHPRGAASVAAPEATKSKRAGKRLHAGSQGGSLVIYGCMCGKAPPLRWDSWVFREVQARHLRCPILLMAFSCCAAREACDHGEKLHPFHR